MSTEIITATEQALGQIQRILEQEGLVDQAVRVGISEKSPTGFVYQLDFCDRSEKLEHCRFPPWLSGNTSPIEPTSGCRTRSHEK